ncbi:MAC/perforin domain-containing protein [Chryseobacterium sp. WG14]|uniref:MAC/perforin domain-containing protein n=1 Tax=Chryseobacterium sp. WG14 TaxID=2926909 RepID=UPI00211E3D97|nr:MAC/perforin domain-containing protein [Chryseobacterium sp. WG14]MCQ9641808.1 MAC/perforin domain-containing protein [Chryseobacterium sp. WG14]
MTKQIVFCFSSLLMLLLASCSSEDLSSEMTAEQQTKTSRSVVGRSAGDGAYDILGHGYNAAGEYANANAAGFKVIDIDRFKAEQGGRILAENTYSQEYVEDYGENAETYSKMVATKVNATAGIPLFKKTLSVGFNSAVTTNHKFDAKYIYGSYNLLIKQRRLRFNATADMLGDYLTPEFSQDLQNKTPQQIVQDYGTHVAVDIYTGAKMDIMFQSETTNESRARAARIGVKVGLLKVFDVDAQNDVDTSESSKNFSRKLSYRTRGGDPSKGLIGEINIDQNTSKINIANWQNSSTVNNAVLVDFGNDGLIFIYDLIKDPVKKAQLKAYVNQYLIDNKVMLDYIPVPIYGFYSGQERDHYLSHLPIIPNTYVAEGEFFKAYTYKAPGTIPVYKYYSPQEKDHYYSTYLGTPSTYTYEGIAFYATMDSTKKPIYQFYSPSQKDHYYIASPGGAPVTPREYIAEGIPFYAY